MLLNHSTKRALDLLVSVASPLLYVRVILKLFVKLLGVKMSCLLHLVVRRLKLCPL